MEIVQVSIDFHEVMKQFNNLAPSIEPTATGHLIEQIDLISKIMSNGYAYESNGSVYFDVSKYNETYDYGELSGRKIDELISNTRDLDGQDEKRNPLDFALWKKASPTPYEMAVSLGIGFPGWHLECSAMSSKYLGEHLIFMEAVWILNSLTMNAKLHKAHVHIIKTLLNIGCMPTC